MATYFPDSTSISVKIMNYFLIDLYFYLVKTYLNIFFSLDYDTCTRGHASIRPQIAFFDNLSDG